MQISSAEFMYPLVHVLLKRALNSCILYVRAASLPNDDLSKTSQCLRSSLWMYDLFCGLSDAIAQRGIKTTTQSLYFLM